MTNPYLSKSVSTRSGRQTTRPSRRQLLQGFLASVALPPAWGIAQTTPPDAPFHFLPAGQGQRDGSDWENAAALDQITEFVSDAQPGQTFLCAVDDNTMPVGWSGPQIEWGLAGTPEEPVTLNFGTFNDTGEFAQPGGPDAPAQFLMLGNETGPEERPDVGGDPHVVFDRGSSHIRVSGPVFDRAGGNGFFNLDVRGTLQDIAFSGIHARNVGRVIETEDGTVVQGLTVTDCTALGMIRGFARFRDLSEAEFRDLDLDADFVDGGGGMVCQIISVSKGHDLYFNNLRLAKAVNMLAAEERGSTYIQGDGLVLEEDTRDVRIENCHASDMGDGGFDLKTENVYLRNCTTTRCKLGIRIWSHHPDNLIENCRMTEPVRRPRNDGSCLWVAGNVTLRDCEMAAVDEMSPIRFGEGQDKSRDGIVKIQGGTITHAEDVRLATGSAGTIELENVMVNGVETSGRYHWNGWWMRSL
ncbi:right-handed parallel beta-helix repeat-containing protein [Yoonia maricola]|nr:right-handed parallel beta-helix repeat-containing protein [Yoonia maricola]